MRLQGLVEIDDMQDVEQLPLIFVEPLHLHIKDGIRIYDDSVVFQDIRRKTHFVLSLDLHEFPLRLLLHGKPFQLG